VYRQRYADISGGIRDRPSLNYSRNQRCLSRVSDPARRALCNSLRGLSRDLITYNHMMHEIRCVMVA
jgi:hypothetical protein